MNVAMEAEIETDIVEVSDGALDRQATGVRGHLAESLKSIHIPPAETIGRVNARIGTLVGTPATRELGIGIGVGEEIKPIEV